LLNQKAHSTFRGWLESVDEDLKNMGVRNWRHKQQYREQWRTMLQEFKIHHGPLYQRRRKKKKKKKTTTTGATWFR
jgi:hypothetical protein